MEPQRITAILLLGSTWGCVSNERPKFWRDPDGHITVTGPMVGPADSLEALAPQLCEQIRSMPGATAGHQRGGQEYCGAVYQRPGDTRFFASHPSSIGHPLDLPGGRKACLPPSSVLDPEATSVSIHSDYHSHPAITKFSPEDLQARRQRFYFRVMFNPICEVYLYDFQARTVYHLQGNQFVFIKQVTDDIRGE
jgi:hypothetical protein